MSRERPDLGAIALCALLGSGIAGGLLGLLFAVGNAEYTDSLAEALYLIVVGAPAGAMGVAVFGGPVGLAIGALVVRFGGRTILHAALTGALTGAAYPTVFLAAGADISQLSDSYRSLTVLGAISGAIAYWAVIGRKAPRRA